MSILTRGYGQTDRPTNRPTDRPTDIATYRASLAAKKTQIQIKRLEIPNQICILIFDDVIKTGVTNLNK